MIDQVIVPSMGESITEVHIGELLVPSGSSVEEGQEILEIETEKVNQLLYATKKGLLEWSVKKGDVVRVGDPIATISTAEAGKQPSPASPPAPPSQPPPQKQEEKAAINPIRKEASDFLAEIDEKPSSTTSPTPKRASHEERSAMSPMRTAIADRLLKAKAETAALTTFNEVDMTKIIEYRQKYQELFKKRHGVKLGFLSFFVKATLMALREYPIIGSVIEGREIVRKEPLDIGIAVSTDRGLIVPVLREGEKLSFPQVEKEIETLANKARTGGLSLDEIRGAVFTITNGGVFGSLVSTPILNFPQSAILGLHKIEKRAVVIEDAVVIRSMMYLALTYDHRLIDGREAVLFLVRIKESLEDPERMLIGI